MTDDIILEARGLTKEFKGFMAIREVDLQVRRGTIHMTASSPAMRKRLVLMRHGEVRYFEADGRPVDPRTVVLTEEGRGQAAAAAAMLADHRFDRALCSSPPRTRETAAFVLAESGIVVEVLHELREIRGGRFAEVAMSDIDRVIGRAFDCAHEDAVFIGGEGFADFGSPCCTKA